jgi:hypothetical protein
LAVSLRIRPTVMACTPGATSTPVAVTLVRSRDSGRHGVCWLAGPFTSAAHAGKEHIVGSFASAGWTKGSTDSCEAQEGGPDARSDHRHRIGCGRPSPGEGEQLCRASRPNGRCADLGARHHGKPGAKPGHRRLTAEAAMKPTVEIDPAQLDQLIRERVFSEALDHPRGSPPARFTGTPADQGKRFLLRVSGLSWPYPHSGRKVTEPARRLTLSARAGEDVARSRLPSQRSSIAPDMPKAPN